MSYTVSIDPGWNFTLDRDDVTILEWDCRSEPPQSHIDLVVAPHFTHPQLMDRVAPVSPRLLQLGSIGYDTIPAETGSTAVANAATVHETSTAEHALAMLLYLARDFDRSVLTQRDQTWSSFYTQGLADSTVLLIGVGGVGTAIADRLEAYEVNLLRVGSHARDDDRGHIFSTDDLPELLPQADSVIVVVPHNESTDRMINEDFLELMKGNAILINIARGKVADTQALLSHANRLRIGLDVTDPEPLPDGHELFSQARLITAHNGGNAAAMHVRMKELVERQIDALVSGAPFHNVVRQASEES